MPLSARADVRTDTPERYAKQLVAHLGHRLTFTTTGSTSTAAIGDGVGAVEVGDGILTLHASAQDPETLDRIQDVLGRHLERFGTRAELTVVWTAA
jgi:hypothetical protein